MKNKFLCLFVAFLVMGTGMAGHVQAAEKISAVYRPSQSPEEAANYFQKPPLRPTYVYYIQPGDLLAMRWLDGPELSGEAMQCEVTSEGKIKYPYLGDIFVAGLTPDELAHGLEVALKKYFATPQVYVLVARKTEASYVAGTFTIYGEVGRPGKYKMAEGLTVSEAIFGAGGFTEFARKNGVRVLRAEGKEKKKIRVKVGKLFKTGNETLDMVVKEGDTILVPESWF